MFGGAVRKKRVAFGWTQETLAERCGLHVNYLGAVERAQRNISIDNMQRIAESLETTISELLSGDDS